MYWLLSIAPSILLLTLHFRTQQREEILFRASNYWIAVFIAGYYLPIPIFVEGDDGWSKGWGYAFSDFDSSLVEAVGLSLAGATIMSIVSRWDGRKRGERRLNPSFSWKKYYSATKSPHFLGIALSFVVVLSMVAVGISLIGGLSALIAGLSDRIQLFAGLNSFFLPANMLIGATYVSVLAVNIRMPNAKPIAWATFLSTLSILLLLGQKANLYILIVGTLWLLLLPRRTLSVWLLLGGSFMLMNLLMLYEYVFREALIIGFDPEKLTFSGWYDYVRLQVTGNFMQIQNLTLLIDAVPERMSLELGATYVAMLYVAIPQAFIDAKPLTAAGVFTNNFWPEVASRETTTMPPGLFGEAFLNFGIFGFLACAVVVGLVLRWADKPVIHNVPPTQMQLLAAVCLGSMSLHFLRGELFAPMLIVAGMVLGIRLSLRAENRSP